MIAFERSTHRGDLRLDEDGGRFPQAAVQGQTQSRMDIPTRSGGLQSRPNGPDITASGLKRPLRARWKSQSAPKTAENRPSNTHRWGLPDTARRLPDREPEKGRFFSTLLVA